jgi:hypothetical protein
MVRFFILSRRDDRAKIVLAGRNARRRHVAHHLAVTLALNHSRIFDGSAIAMNDEALPRRSN